MAETFVTDTHALHWHLAGTLEERSPAAYAVFRSADAGLCRVLVPSISVFELSEHCAKGKVPESMFDRLVALLRVPQGSYTVAAFDLAICEAARAISRVAVPDPFDRIIIATALRAGRPLVSRDGKIRETRLVEIVW